MMSFIDALNHPADAFHKQNKAVSWGLVIITVLINSIFEPVLQHFCSTSTSHINVLHMLKITGLGIVSYVLICTAFWIVCKCFGSKGTLTDHINAWGISYAPTAICAVVVAFTEVFFYVFWNSTIWGMLLNIVFVGILIWKAILYFIYLKEFAKLNGLRFFGACAVMGVIILVMAVLNGYVGVKTPVL
jgi:hypothetical protein